MLNIHQGGARLCDGLTRREALRLGGLGVFGLSMPQLLRQSQARAASAPTARAKSCIVLFLMGGPPQHSTWDPKPDAPAEVRGDFEPIATNVPGMSDLRADAAHRPRGRQALRPARHVHRRQRPLVQRLLHAHRPAAPADELRERQPRPAQRLPQPRAPSSAGSRMAASGLPAAVTLPHRIFNTDGSVWPGQDAGFLGRAPTPGSSPAMLTTRGYRIRRVRPARRRRRRSDSDGRSDLLRPTGRPELDCRGRTRTAATLRRADPSRRSTCCGRPSPRRAFRLDRGAGSVPRPLRPDARSARACCWPAGWSRRASAGAGQLVSRPRRAARQPLLGQPCQGEPAG